MSREGVWSNPYKRIDSKIRIYKTCIRPLMTYGTEMREGTNKMKSILRAFEKKTLRTIVGKTQSRNTNTETDTNTDTESNSECRI